MVEVVIAMGTIVCENVSNPFLHNRPAESNQHYSSRLSSNLGLSSFNTFASPIKTYMYGKGRRTYACVHIAL